MQVSANGIQLEVEDHGPVTGEPLLLIMGLGMQLVAWHEDFVARLVQRGFRVIRFDNRDIGLSQRFDHLGVSNLAIDSIKYAVGLKVTGPYTVADMADDTAGLLDALGIPSAHVCGASMGGMIAQHMAASRPERVARLTLIMTSSGSRKLPQASAKVRAALLERRAMGARGLDAEVERLMRLFTLIGSPAFRPEPQAMRARLRASVQRAWRPDGVARQLVAVAADGDRTPLLSRITSPTHIVHGADDPLVPVAAAHDLHTRIAGSTLEVIDGMGHDLPAELWPRFAAAMAPL